MALAADQPDHFGVVRNFIALRDSLGAGLPSYQAPVAPPIQYGGTLPSGAPAESGRGGGGGGTTQGSPSGLRQAAGNFVAQGQLGDWIKEIGRIAGLSGSEMDALATMAKYESGGRNIVQTVRDVNSGGNEAFGPWQVIPGTFRSNAWGPQYGDRANPVHNGLAAVNYARRKYGSLENVANRFKRTGKGGY